MKRFIIPIISVFLVLASCQKEDPSAAGSGGQEITVSFTGTEVTVTKANGIGNEDRISDAQLLVFNSAGELYRHKSLTAAEITAMSVTVTNVNVGSYTLALVANGPSDLSTTVTTLTGLKAVTLKLEDYNATGSDFVMWGTTTASVTADATASVSVELKRHVGRVVVSKITNGIPAAMGSLTVNEIMLTNVYAKVTMEGEAVTSGALWYNMEGRSDTSSPLISGHIINGGTYTSQCADLTYRSIGSSVANGASYTTAQYLYGYQNNATTSPDGFVASYPSTGYRCCLVVSATFNGHKWYYPVVLDGFKKHTTYDVKLTIIGEGSEDPNKPVKKGSIKTDITVADWTVGTSYDKTI